MANKTEAKKKSTRTGSSTTTKRRTVKKSSHGVSTEAKEMVNHYSDAAQKQIRKLGKSISSVKDKEVKTLKDFSGKVRQFANKAAQLTKLKIEIHNLKEEHENLVRVMGENLWNMHKSNKVTQVKSKLKYDFTRLQEVEAEIKEKKRTASRITTFLKNIR